MDCAEVSAQKEGGIIKGRVILGLGDREDGQSEYDISMYLSIETGIDYQTVLKEVKIMQAGESIDVKNVGTTGRPKYIVVVMACKLTK